MAVDNDSDSAYTPLHTGRGVMPRADIRTEVVMIRANAAPIL